VTSVRGIGFDPTTAASWELGVIGFMNAALGVLFPPFFAAFFVDFFADDFFAAFFPDDFFPPLFFLVAIASPGG
jgi:hypothetical protein